MRKFLKVFLNLIFKMQEKAYELPKNNLYSYSNGTSSSHITSFATVSFDLKTREKAQKIKLKVKEIVKKNIKTPEKLLEYVEKAGTKVVRIPYADKILSHVNEQEGFITPKSGLEALYLNFILNKKISFKMPEMFVLRDLPLNIYVMSHQFHKWYAYKMGLPGYDENSQENFKKVFEFEDENKVKELSYSEVMALKEAVRRDLEAIDFVLELSKEQEGSKKTLDEQTAKYISEHLSPLEEDCLTPSMISNYVKKKLIANPVKKQYGRDQIVYLFFVLYSKVIISRVLELFYTFTPCFCG